MLFNEKYPPIKINGKTGIFIPNEEIPELITEITKQNIKQIQQQVLQTEVNKK